MRKLIAGLTVTIGMMVTATVALTVLKLTGQTVVADWDWWAVAAPLWVPPALVWAAGMVLGFGLLADRGMQRLESRNRNK